MALDGHGHQRPIALPERGAALDVGEEKGDGAGGKIRHCLAPDVLSQVVFGKIVAPACPDHVLMRHHWVVTNPDTYGVLMSRGWVLAPGNTSSFVSPGLPGSGLIDMTGPLMNRPTVAPHSFEDSGGLVNCVTHDAHRFQM